MADQGGGFNFFQRVGVRIDITIDISVSIRLMTTTFGKQVHLQELTEMRLTKQMLVTSSHQDHVTNKNISSLPECIWPPKLAKCNLN